MERRLVWGTCVNVRDLGGLRAADGVTRRGVLIRASTLGVLTPADASAIQNAGVRTVIDLRWPTEVQSTPSPYAASAIYRHVPVDAPMKMDLPGHAEAGTLPELLRIMADPASGLRAAVEAVAEAEPAIVIHCSAGRDRTGFVVAVILASIGVHDSEIVDDHCLSDAELEPEYERVRRENPEYAERLPAIIARRPETLRALLKAIRDEYGDAQNYLMSLGVSPRSIDELCRKLI